MKDPGMGRDDVSKSGSSARRSGSGNDSRLPLWTPNIQKCMVHESPRSLSDLRAARRPEASGATPGVGEPAMTMFGGLASAAVAVVLLCPFGEARASWMEDRGLIGPETGCSTQANICPALAATRRTTLLVPRRRPSGHLELCQQLKWRLGESNWWACGTGIRYRLAKKFSLQ